MDLTDVEFARLVADGVVEKLNTLPDELFRNHLTPFAQEVVLTSSKNTSAPYRLRIDAAESRITLRFVDPFGCVVATLVYGRTPDGLAHNNRRLDVI